MNDEIAPVLARAEELVLRGWCQGKDAQDSSENAVLPTSPAAVQFDARGAIRRACDELGLPAEIVLEEVAEALDDVLRPPGVEKMGKLSIVGWNDRKDMTQARVADGLRRARTSLQTNLAD